MVNHIWLGMYTQTMGCQVARKSNPVEVTLHRNNGRDSHGVSGHSPDRGMSLSELGIQVG